MGSGIITEVQMGDVLDPHRLTGIGEVDFVIALCIGRRWKRHVAEVVSEVDNIVAGTSINRVVAQNAYIKGIASCATEQRIASCPGDEGIIAATSLQQLVGPAAALERIVVAIAGAERLVISTTSNQQIAIAASGDN